MTIGTATLPQLWQLSVLLTHLDERQLHPTFRQSYLKTKQQRKKKKKRLTTGPGGPWRPCGPALPGRPWQTQWTLPSMWVKLRHFLHIKPTVTRLFSKSINTEATNGNHALLSAGPAIMSGNCPPELDASNISFRLEHKCISVSVAWRCEV